MSQPAWPIWFKASKAMPPEIAASPIKVTTRSSRPSRSRLSASPKATDSESEACPESWVS